jgi:hypothetical protein
VSTSTSRIYIEEAVFLVGLRYNELLLAVATNFQ